MPPVASRRAIKVPLVQERQAPEVRASAVPETASLAMPFALDGFEEPERDHEVDQSARHTAAAVRHLLTAGAASDAVSRPGRSLACTGLQLVPGLPP